MAKKAKFGVSTAPRDKPKKGLDVIKKIEINTKNVNKKNKEKVDIII